MGPSYLSSDSLVLRPLQPQDAKASAGWYRSPFPVSPPRAGTLLTEMHTAAWGQQAPLILAIVERHNQDIVGAVEMSNPRARTASISITTALTLGLTDADRLGANVIPILIPWLRDELEMMSITLPLASDQTASAMAAEAQGMTMAVRLREHVGRPGTRVDLLFYQLLGAPWSIPPQTSEPRHA
ncbi:MAG TPA: GNAT family protein [Thermomicrobiales bacterium]|nr:GNAT family protein [Thermomicrobiales bacterium]